MSAALELPAPGLLWRHLRRAWGRSYAGDADPEIRLGARDCHCHVLPAVDDGSRDLAESRAMLRLLIDVGVRQVVATPHVYAGAPNDLDALRRRFDAFVVAVADLPLALELGAEYHLDATMAARITQGEVLAFGLERYVLVECPPGGGVPVSLLRIINLLADRGYTPLLAHVERYAWLRGPDRDGIAAVLRGAGARFQVNRAIGGAQPGRGPRGRALAWLKARGWIDEVGSDLHRATPDGRPDVRPAAGYALDT